MSAIIYWQNPCKLPVSFRCIKAFMHAFSGRFSRASLEGISFKFFVCFIFNVSLGKVPKRKNFDIQRKTRVGSGGQFTSNRLSCHHMILFPCKLRKHHFALWLQFPTANITGLLVINANCLNQLFSGQTCLFL